MMTAAIIVVVTGALLVGAAWGIFGPMPGRFAGFLVAVAGGSLLVSVVLELIEPATDDAAVWWVGAAVLVGAGTFTAIDTAVSRRWGSDEGGGLLVTITLDGLPENLALGVALIGAEPLTVAALGGSILLSNLPEAAGGAKQMSEGGRSNAAVFGLWAATAALLAAAALAGNLLLDGVPPAALALIRSFAAGAVIASLATEVFPQAFGEDSYLAGIAAAVGSVLAIALDSL